MHRFLRGRLLVLSLIMLALGVVAFLGCPPSGKRVALRFLAYTNNRVARIALFEITNHSAGAVSWTLHADGRLPGFRVAVTDIVETNGEMRHIGSGGPLNLFGHDSLQFGTDELKPAEKVWVSIRPYPTTAMDRQRERLSRWLYRLGWHSGARQVARGTRVDGPVLP